MVDTSNHRHGQYSQSQAHTEILGLPFTLQKPMTQNTAKGIFFDLGGTLTTANPSVAEQIVQTLADFGHPFPHHEVANALDSRAPQFEDPSNSGWTLTHERSYAFWTHYYDSVLAELGISSAARRDIVLRIYGNLSQPQGYGLYPDVIPVLERLAGEGYTLALISNWEAWGAELVEYLGISRYFPTQVLSGCVGVEKPDAQIFKMALEQADMAPERVLFIGDIVQLDIEPANAIGMRAVLIDRHAERSNTDPSCIRSLHELHDHAFLRSSTPGLG